MKIFLDTANIEEIRKSVATGIVSGVTTNPTLISRENKPFEECISNILGIDKNLTVLAEVIASDTDAMITEAEELSAISDNIVVKIPMTEQGIAAVKVLSQRQVRTAVTLVFSLNQAIAAACAGANYVAPFVGRMEDVSSDGVALVRAIKKLFEAQHIDTKIIAASIRTARSVAELFSANCDIVTMPDKIFHAMFNHPLTDIGLRKFNEDWEKVPIQ